MPPRTPRPLADLLHSGSLADLAREAARRRTLAEQIRALLPPEEASHLVAASIGEDGELVLVMDAPAWAARARYRAQQIGRHRVRVKVAPRS